MIPLFVLRVVLRGFSVSLAGEAAVDPASLAKFPSFHHNSSKQSTSGSSMARSNNRSSKFHDNCISKAPS